MYLSSNDLQEYSEIGWSLEVMVSMGPETQARGSRD